MPSNRQLFLDHLGQTSKNPIGIEIEKAKGVFLYDKEGNDYIDLVSGVSVSNLGHGNPVIIDAIKNQLDKYMHLMVYGEFIQEPQVKFAEALTSILPKHLNTVYLVNSGSEAIDGAIKLAKKYTKRYEIISCKNAYHGSTHGALSIFGGPSLKDPFRPLPTGVKHIRYNNFDDIKKISKKTAAVVIEPIQGEGGIILPKEDYLQKIRNRCDETGTLLIFDEIQTGFGRTGHYFAFQKFKVQPDILAIAKAMGGGLPIGGWVCDKNIMEALTENPELGHITTFGGHPVSAAAANANIRYLMNNNNLLKDVNDKSQLFYDGLINHPAVIEIRHCGLYMAVKLKNSKNLYKIMEIFKDNGIISDWFIFDDEAFRISPPITINEKEIEIAVKRIIKSLDYL